MNQTHRLLGSVEHDDVIIGLRDDHIVHIYFKPNCEINGRTEERVRQAVQKLANPGRLLPVIFEAGEFVAIDPESRNNLHDVNFELPVLCYAVYVRNAAQRLLANYYRKLARPVRPFSTFRDFQSGIDWCLKYSKEAV